jgi:hypothetical protein
VICPTCGAEFETRKSNKKYCNYLCQYRMAQRRYKRKYMPIYRAQYANRIGTSPLAQKCLDNQSERYMQKKYGDRG